MFVFIFSCLGYFCYYNVRFQLCLKEIQRRETGVKKLAAELKEREELEDEIESLKSEIKSVCSLCSISQYDNLAIHLKTEILRHIAFIYIHIYRERINHKYTFL